MLKRNPDMLKNLKVLGQRGSDKVKLDLRVKALNLINYIANVICHPAETLSKNCAHVFFQKFQI